MSTEEKNLSQSNTDAKEQRKDSINLCFPVPLLLCVMLFILLLATWLAARGLNADAIWFDEHWSLYYAGARHFGPLSPVELWTRVANESTWPPLYHFTLAGWSALAGWSHFMGRALSLFCGLLAIAWTYRLGRTLFRSSLVAIGAAAAIGASALFIDYMHELRGYTYYAMLTPLFVWAYWRVLTAKRPRKLEQAALVIGTAGLLYLHYFAALTLIVIGLYHLLFAPKNRRWWQVSILLAIGGALFLPWAGVVLADVGDATGDENRQAMALTTWEALRELVYTFSNGSIAFAALIGTFALGALRTRAGRFVWFWTLVALALALLVNGVLQALIHVRYLLGLWPPLALLFGVGISQFVEATGQLPVSRTKTATLILFIWIASGIAHSFDPAFVNDLHGARRRIPWPELSRVLETVSSEGRSRDVVVFHVETPGQEWLTERSLAYYMHDLPQRHTQTEAIAGQGDDYVRGAQTFIDDAPFVWFATMPDVPTTYHVEQFERALSNSSYADCGVVFATDRMRLELYAHPPGIDMYSGDFGDIRMANLGPLRREGNVLHVLLGWNVSRNAPPDTYSVGLHVLNADGTLAAQIDYPVPEPGYSCIPSAVSLANLPAGDYTVNVLVYDWRTGERLTNAETDSDSVRLGGFEIE